MPRGCINWCVAMQTLANYVTRLNEIRSQFPDLLKQLVTIEPEFDKLVKKHDTEWDKLRDQWNQQLLDKLTSIGIKLTELQQKDILRHDTLAEVIHRFETLELKPPAQIE